MHDGRVRGWKWTDRIDKSFAVFDNLFDNDSERERMQDTGWTPVHLVTKSPRPSI